MKMKNLEEIEKLKNVSDKITKGIKDHYEKIRDSSCDKNGIGFNLDSRFSSNKGVTVTVDSWKGYYGDSGCSNSIGSLDDEIFNKHFLKILNLNFNKLMLDTAKSIESEMGNFANKAKRELENKLETINKYI